MYSLLHSKGYYAVPVNSDGVPCVKIYEPGTRTERQHSEDEIDSWEERYESNIALLCGRNDVTMIDVDCNDPVVSRSLLAVARKRFNKQLVRYGSPNKFALLIRTEAGGYTGSSIKYDSPNGVQVIEIKPRNTTMTIFGPHRKYDDVEYKWTRRFTPTIVPAEDLPLWTLDDVQWFTSEFERRADVIPKWNPKTRNTVRRGGTIVAVDAEGNDVEESLEDYDGPTRQWTLEDLEMFASVYDPDDRDQWMRYGMVVQDFYVREEGFTAAQGLKYWIEWSKQSDNFGSEDECMNMWHSFVPCKPGKGVTMESANKDYQEHMSTLTPEEKVVELQIKDFYMKNFILVETPEKMMVADLTQPINDCMKPFAVVALGQSNRVIMGVDPKTGKRDQRLNPVKWWASQPGRKKAVGVTYKPCGDVMIPMRKVHGADTMEGSQGDFLFNTYEGSHIVPLESFRSVNEEKFKLIRIHLEQLFPTDLDMERILTQIAHAVQRPWERPSNHILHINLAQGSGRGFLFELIKKLLGPHNCTSAKMSQIGSGWDDWRYNSVWCDVAEMDSHGSETSKYTMSDDLKSALTDTSALLNLKMKSQQNAEVYTRVMFNSNNGDPIKLTENDRRFWVVKANVKYQSDEYYEKLYATLDDEEIMQHMLAFFSRYKYNKTMIYPNAKQCMTPAKMELIRTLRTPEESAMYAMRDVIGSLPVSRQMLSDYIASAVGGTFEDELGINQRHLNHLIIELMQENVVLRHSSGTMGAPLQFRGVSEDIELTEGNVKTLMAQAETKLKESLK